MMFPGSLSPAALQKTLRPLFCVALLALLNACANGFEPFEPPSFSLAQATSMTDDQAKALIQQILARARARQQQRTTWNATVPPSFPQFYEEWPVNPVIRSEGYCNEILGFEEVKKIAFENLEFTYLAKDGAYAVFSAFTKYESGRGCSDKPMGVLVWVGVSPEDAKQLSEALYALGAKPREPHKN